MLKGSVKRRIISFVPFIALLLIVLSTSAQASMPSVPIDAPGHVAEEMPVESWPIAVAIAISATTASAAWILVRGSTIGASAMVEKPETSIWGLVLNTIGVWILIYGFIAALMVMVPEMHSLLILVAGEVLVAALALILLMARGLGTTASVERIFPRVASWAVASATVITISILAWMYGGGVVGAVGMIPDAVWPLLLGSITMIGAALAAAICIVAAVKAGSAAMVEKPELSIWSLLFVALGEGLAIYGLIVAILIIVA